MRFIPGNAQHIGSRTEQQDSFAFSNPEHANFLAHGGFLAVLADGAGGMKHGQAAGRVAVKTFLSAYQEKFETEAIGDALERALMEANNAVQELAEEENSVDNVASTLVAAVLHEDELYWIAVGDSALYLYRAGTLSLLSESHIYGRRLDQEAADGRISKDAALNHPERDALTSYLGKKTLEEIDKSTARIMPTDRILLASDGLFRTLGDQEISVGLGESDPQHACESLIQKVLAKGREHQDNVTVLCVDIWQPEQERPTTTPIQPKTGATRISAWLNAIFSRSILLCGRVAEQQ